MASSALLGSATAEFVLCCRAHGVKRPNPMLVTFFQEEEPVMMDIEDIDLGRNYVGNRGIMALLDLITKLPNFRSLSLRNQKLYNTDLNDDPVKGNAVVDRVVETFTAHPSVTALDISNNPISNYAGRRLLSLVQQNKRMCRVDVSSTRIDFELRRRIATAVEENVATLWENQETEADGDDGAFPEKGEGEEVSFGGFGGWTSTVKSSIDLSSLGGGGTRRKTVRAEGLDPEKARNYVPPVVEKPEADIVMIVNLLSHNVLFSFLGSRDLRVVALAMVRRDFQRGDDIMAQNGISDALYVLQNGHADILKEGQRVFVKTTGTAVGELELMYDAPCAATVRVASEDCLTWRLDRDTYRYLVMGTAIRRREEYSTHINNVPFLQPLSFYEKMQVADALSSDEYDTGDHIIRFDHEGEWMFILLEGTVEVIGRDQQGAKKHVCTFSQGEYFGELEFLNNHRTVADVVATTFVRTAKLNRRHFEMCLGPIMDVLKRNTTHPKYDYYRSCLEGRDDEEEPME